ncbi:MAG: glycosyl hydrolase family 28-related protein [Planctomycetota bacterium]
MPRRKTTSIIKGTGRTRTKARFFGRFCLFALAGVIYASASTQRTIAQDRLIDQKIVYPEKALIYGGLPTSKDDVARERNQGLVVDLTMPPYNDVGDGVTDNTQSFKSALNDIQTWLTSSHHTKHPSSRYRLYLPKGIYVVSDSLLPDGDPIKHGFSYVRWIGESRDETIIRLKDRSPGFGEGARKPVITTYNRNAPHVGGLMWGNQISNLTVETGRDNPGAVGVEFVSANAGSIDNLTIRSNDGQGYAGLWMSDWSQQGYFCDLTINGFDYGIRTEGIAETNPIFEFITLTNQRRGGVLVNRSAPCMRNVLVEDLRSGSAIEIVGKGAHCVMLDSLFACKQSSKEAAVDLRLPGQQQLYLRNIASEGFSKAVSNVEGDRVKEWHSGRVFRSEKGSPDRSLGLPIEDPPVIRRLSSMSDWTCPEDFDGGSDFERISKALRSGKAGVYFPRRYYTPPDRPLVIPASVKQLDFMKSNSWIRGGVVIDQIDVTPLSIEGAGRKMVVELKKPRKLYVRNSGISLRVTTEEPVTAHLSNIAVLAAGHADEFCPPNATIYARSINEESQSHTNWVANGGTLWCMGFKTESDGTAFHAKRGAMMEVLGGYVNFAGPTDEQNPDLINEDSHVSYVGTNFMGRVHREGIHEIRKGKLFKRFPNEFFPRRPTGNNGNYFVPLYSGFDPEVVRRRTLAD